MGYSANRGHLRLVSNRGRDVKKGEGGDSRFPSAKRFLELVKIVGGTQQASRDQMRNCLREWSLLKPLCVSVETLEKLAKILPESRFQLLDPQERGVSREILAAHLAKMREEGVPNLVGENMNVGRLPCFNGTIGGQAYPTFSVGLMEKERYLCMSTGFLKSVHADEGASWQQRSRGDSSARPMTHVIGHDFKQTLLSQVSPWTFFVDIINK